MQEQENIEVQPNAQRMLVEYSELQDRVAKLHAFIIGETFKTLSHWEMRFTELQLASMVQYMFFLEQRINLMTNPVHQSEPTEV